MSKDRIAIRLHRFHDDVAMYVPKHGTMYMSWKQAMELAQHLNDYVNDIDKNAFVNSNIGDRYIK